jgi:hypothetical protein
LLTCRLISFLGCANLVISLSTFCCRRGLRIVSQSRWKKRFLNAQCRTICMICISCHCQNLCKIVFLLPMLLHKFVNRVGTVFVARVSLSENCRRQSEGPDTRVKPLESSRILSMSDLRQLERNECNRHLIAFAQVRLPN